uniref:N-acetyltransferase domain-containing protein n=1 Tax=Sinocyclocheilus rhinocerous TaxID=307959 RepID=A0A673KC93_9TELE
YSIIRPYKPTDKSAIVSLCCFGILEHVYPAFFKAMSHPDHIGVTLSVSVAGYVLGGSSYFQAVLFGGAWACLVYYCCHEIYDAYLRRKLEVEVADIQANFSDSQANGFWVVEMELNGKSEVAGLLAAVKSDGWDADAVDAPSLEVFQLVVSFNQRRKGLGTQLLETAVEFCKEQGLSRVIVEISSLNGSLNEILFVCFFGLVSLYCYMESKQKPQPINNTNIIVSCLNYIYIYILFIDHCY